jgi:hypothetical protein
MHGHLGTTASMNPENELPPALRKPEIDFIVLGLPRSGTTWLANWLTTDTSLCLHDPFNYGLPDLWPRDERAFGISCTGSFLLPGWLAQYDCPIAVIEREGADCDRSLSRIGLEGVSSFAEQLRQIRGRHWTYLDLWDETKAGELWAYLRPNAPFDVIRYRLLLDMQVQPHLGRCNAYQSARAQVRDAYFSKLH